MTEARTARTLAAALSAALLLAIPACALIPALDDRAVAVWELAPQQQLDDDTTEIVVLVTRLGCNSGVTGTVNEPTISITEADVVITFTVSPGPPEAADCQGNNQVPYELTLPDPLGDRRLIDGVCADSEASRTTFCETDERNAP